MQELLEKIPGIIYDGDDEQAALVAQQAIEAGADPETIINCGVAGLEKLGKAFDEMEAFLPELMLAGDAMHALLEVVKPYLPKTDSSQNATIVVGCAQGDLHDIGLNLVATQLSVGGFNVINLGTDTSVAKFIETAKSNDAKIIGVSSLLTTSAYYQDELIKKLNKEGLRNSIKVIVGGGPITPDWTRKIGADGYSRTANMAVQLCRRLLAGEAGPIIVE